MKTLYYSTVTKLFARSPRVAKIKSSTLANSWSYKLRAMVTENTGEYKYLTQKQVDTICNILGEDEHYLGITYLDTKNKPNERAKLKKVGKGIDKNRYLVVRKWKDGDEEVSECNRYTLDDLINHFNTALPEYKPEYMEIYKLTGNGKELIDTLE